MPTMGIDTELLSRYAAPPTEARISDSVFINWMGLETATNLFPQGASLAGRRFVELPTGSMGDGVYGGYFEYAALITTIEQAAERETFTAVELGAGWGPWISAAGMICNRLGFKKINLVGVEADAEKCAAMEKHFARNGLSNRVVSLKVIQAAAWKEDGVLHFPVIPLGDYGAAASEEANEIDYRGAAPAAYVEVPAKSLKTISAGLGRIDYMHWDIQGAEADLAISDPDFLNDNVVSIFIGTHSRKIEGDLLQFFSENGWEVVAHHPCHYLYNRAAPSLLAMLHTDGEIVARNPRLWRGPGI